MTSLQAVGSWRKGPPDGLRRFNPARDLAAVIQLLKQGFGRDLDAQELQWLADLEAVAEAGPLLALLKLVPPLDGAFGGYVWYVDGQLVGNASLMKGPRRTWTIANVVTHADYRRRGIARRLTEEVIKTARLKGADRIELQVRHSNEAAQNLYRGLGFSRVHGVTTLRLPDVGSATRLGEPATGFSVVEWSKAGDARARRLISRMGRSVREPIPGPLVEAAGPRSIVRRFEDFVSGRTYLRWAALDSNEFRAVIAAVSRTGGASHRLELIAERSWRDRVEGPLVDACLIALARKGGAPAEAQIRDSEHGARRALEAAGFKFARTLERLALDLN